VKGNVNLYSIVQRTNRIFNATCDVKEEFLLSEICQHFHPEFFSPEGEIIHRFTFGRTLYFIYNGEVRVTTSDNSHRDSVVKERGILDKIMGPLEFFGEISLHYKCQRTANVMSTGYTTLARLDHNSYIRLGIDFPGFEDMVLEQIYSY
jgi:CRP-like cAMP-binding protein